jgi:hypothetical protein
MHRDSAGNAIPAPQISPTKPAESMLKKISRFILWLLFSLMVVTLLCYLVLVVINWSDRPPGEAAIEMEKIHQNRPAVADDENSYFFILGFDGEKDQDPQLLGLQRAAWISNNKNHLESYSSVALWNSYDFEGERSSTIVNLSQACQHTKRLCYQALRDAEVGATEWISKEAWLLERYQQLLLRTKIREDIPVDLSLPIPQYQKILEAQKLLLIKTWMLARQGEVEQAGDLLNRDFIFWRSVSKDADILITKMIAVTALKNHLIFSSQMNRGLFNADQPIIQPESWEKPISKEELSYKRVLAGEWYFSRNIIDVFSAEFFLSSDEYETTVFDRVKMAILTPFFKKQDSLNRHAEYLGSLAASFEVSLDSYPTLVGREKKLIEHTLNPEDSGISHYVYNGVGKAMLTVASGHFENYILRTADVEGLRRLVILVMDLTEKNLPPDQIEVAIKDHSLKNPYTNKPFLWNDEDKSIMFQGLEKDERGRYDFRLSESN